MRVYFIFLTVNYGYLPILLSVIRLINNYNLFYIGYNYYVFFSFEKIIYFLLLTNFYYIARAIN